jgi:hypothetical protein
MANGEEKQLLVCSSSGMLIKKLGLLRIGNLLLTSVSKPLLFTNYIKWVFFKSKNISNNDFFLSLIAQISIWVPSGLLL